MGVLLHEDRFAKINFSLNVANCLANTTTIQTFALSGLRVGDIMIVSAPTLNTGLGVVDAYVNTNGILTLRFVNSTAAPINPGVILFSAFFYRAELPVTMT